NAATAGYAATRLLPPYFTSTPRSNGQPLSHARLPAWAGRFPALDHCRRDAQGQQRFRRFLARATSTFGGQRLADGFRAATHSHCVFPERSHGSGIVRIVGIGFRIVRHGLRRTRDCRSDLRLGARKIRGELRGNSGSLHGMWPRAGKWRASSRHRRYRSDASRTVEPAEHVDALLAVGFAIVFLAHHGPVENRIGTDKIVTVFDNVAATLAVRPGEHM